MNEITPLKRGGIPENITVRVQVDLQNTKVFRALATSLR